MGAGNLSRPFVPSEVEGQAAGDPLQPSASTTLGTNGRGEAQGTDKGSIRRAVLIGWVLAAIVLTLVSVDGVAALRFPDPDDAMRLMEVRDWLAGQSWWDVAQHRLNHGDFPMHWSRLVDLPLAAVLTLAAPLGEPAATRIAMTVVPLLALLAVMTAIAAITRRLASAEVARYAVLLVPLSAPLIYQLRPMRIDHHGWQVALALAAIALLLTHNTFRAGAFAGLALATLLTISLEGMPIAVAIAGIAALAWAWHPARRDQFLGLMWSLFAATVLLHLATRGPAFFVPACDAIAPAWLAALGVGAVGASLATLPDRVSLTFRLAVLGAAAAIAGAVLAAGASACLAGPFSQLPPIVYHLWYLGILEGRPIWEQPVDRAIITVALPIVGLVASGRAWNTAEPALKLLWAMLFASLAAALVITLFVNRAGATANALAVPGAATLLAALLARARTVRSVGMRVIATAAALLAASPGYFAVAGKAVAKAIGADVTIDVEQSARTHRCEHIDDMRSIGRLPAGVVFSPLDVAPDLIATTHHSSIAGGYHRSPNLLATVIEAFTSTPDEARRRIFASGADYLAGCPGLNETEIYRRDFPYGLWARLERGERFDWLQPIPTGTPALAWRVIRPLPSPNPRP